MSRDKNKVKQHVKNLQKIAQNDKCQHTGEYGELRFALNEDEFQNKNDAIIIDDPVEGILEYPTLKSVDSFDLEALKHVIKGGRFPAKEKK
jgi:hypothetical protein